MPTAASWSASVTCLVKTIIGAGILGLPYAFAQTGYLLGISLLLLCGAAQWFALHLLAILVLDAKSRGVVAPSFRSLALDAFGNAHLWCWVTEPYLQLFAYYVPLVTAQTESTHERENR